MKIRLGKYRLVLEFYDVCAVEAVDPEGYRKVWSGYSFNVSLQEYKGKSELGEVEDNETIPD